MNQKSVVLGSEGLVLDFYTNKQFSNIKKLIITKDVILNSFDNPILSNFVLGQKNTTRSQYETSFSESKAQGLFEVNFQDEFYKVLQEHLAKISEELNVELKDYSFMSSISNSRYHIVLRTKNFSFYEYYIEKGTLLSSLKSVLQKYLSSPLSAAQLSSLDEFQIEIFESEEYHKSVFLKKENSSLILYSTFGFFDQDKENINLGGELYFSRGEDFTFFENNQEYATIRQHNKVQRKEIIHKEKILNPEELKNINEITKNIDNVTLEIAINAKGAIRILHVSTNEHPIENASDKGILYLASSKEYNKIALITAKEEYSQDAANPQYLLIRNQMEFDEFTRALGEIRCDGIILNMNLYHPVLEEIGAKQDCDILFYKDSLNKSLEVNYSRANLEIEGAVSKSNDSPFSNILDIQNKEKDELLEKLKNIDLSTPTQSGSQDQVKQVENLAQSMMSSPKSSKPSDSSLMSFNSSSNTGEKKSAIELMTESVMNNNMQPQVSQPAQEQPIYQEAQTTYQEPTPQPNYQEPQSSKSSSPFEDFFDENKQQEMEVQPQSIPNVDQSQYNQPEQPTYQEPAPAQSGLDFLDIEPQVQTTVESVVETSTQVSSEDMSKYDSILATRLLTPPNIGSNGHVVDMNSLSQIQDPSQSYVVISNVSELSNPNLQYILPVSMGKHKDAFALINTTDDFFKLSLDDTVQGVIINLSTILPELKQDVLETAVDKFGLVSLIVKKEDISLLENSIEYIDFVFVKDLQSQEDYNQVKENLLTFEKRVLLRK